MRPFRIQKLRKFHQPCCMMLILQHIFMSYLFHILLILFRYHSRQILQTKTEVEAWQSTPYCASE